MGGGGGLNCKCWEKIPQVHLIIIRNDLKITLPSILRNLDNFLPVAFYSTPSPVQLGNSAYLPLQFDLLQLGMNE